MPMVEVDEVELLQNRKLASTLSKIMSNPEARKLAEQAHKLVDANALTPALDQEQKIKEPISALEKKMTDFMADMKKEREDREQTAKLAKIKDDIESGKQALRRQGWTEEGIKGVEALMEEKGLLSVEDAAVIFERKHPPQSPASPSGTGGWNFMESVQDGEGDLKKLLETKGDYEPLADKMAREALNEFRGVSRR